MNNAKLKKMPSMHAWLMAGLMIFAAPSAQAVLGSGWVEHSPAKAVHLDNESGLQTFSWATYRSVCSPVCSDYRYDNGVETFRLLDTRTNRSEIRMLDNYTSGSRQFEGEVRITAPLNDESLMQIWGSTSGATQLMIRGFAASSGSIEGAGTTLVSNAYDRWVKVNVIHLQEDRGNKIIVYIDGVKKAEIADNEAASNYHKYGSYGTLTTGTATVQWRNVKHYRDGNAPSGSGPVTLHQGCNYSGWSTGFDAGSYRMSDITARGGVNDDASSIRVPNGYQATLYQSDSYGGASVILTADNSCLTGVNFNDATSSLVVSRVSTCSPTAITPYLQVNGGTWQQIASATVTAGSTIQFGPQPTSGGSWSWSGCGTSGTSRAQTIAPSASCTATATHVNSCGASSQKAFAVTVTSSGGGTITTTASTTTTTKSGSCSGVAQYVNGNSYNTGAVVQNVSKKFQCKVGGWCSVGGPYAPGTGWAWTEAWTQTGTCS